MRLQTTGLLLITAIALFFVSCKKEDNTPPPVVPVMKIEPASIVRTTMAGTLYFTISLDKTTTVPVTVDYTLNEGTAKAPA